VLEGTKYFLVMLVELFFFILLFFGMLGFVILGLAKGNFALTSLGTVLCLVLGLLLLTQGVTTEKISNFEIVDANTSNPVITPTYEEETIQSPEIWVIGYLLLFGGFIFSLVTAYYAFFQEDREEALM